MLRSSVRDSFLGPKWLIRCSPSAKIPLSPVIRLGLRNPRKKERKSQSMLRVYGCEFCSISLLSVYMCVRMPRVCSCSICESGSEKGSGYNFPHWEASKGRAS